MKQLEMFSTEETAPLFTGTPMKANTAKFEPKPVAKQMSFAQCQACMDTGKIGDKKCWCNA
jgi:hypothetical protein